MKPRSPDQDRPAILYGAVALAVLSLAWSAYAITDLMHSGKFGLSVALAGDIGWITVLWAEYKGVTLGGYRWVATAAGWAIALGVGILLVIHGQEAGGRAQAIAGPFVILVGKIVWAFALEAMKDPTAPTAEQQAEVHAVMRNSAHASALSHARTEATISHIRNQARVTMARDEADFEVELERMDKRAELGRRTPLALPPGTGPALTQRPSGLDFDELAEQANEGIGEQREQSPTITNSAAISPSGQIASKAVNSPNSDREQASLADLVRDQVASTTTNSDAIRGVMKLRPDANRDSVGAAVRRERRRNELKGGYA